MKKYCSIKQEDKYDCGLAALTSIMLYYNKNYLIIELKALISYNPNDKTNLFQLHTLAKEYGFTSEGLFLESFKYLSHINLPCIAQLEIDTDVLHFVVIYEVEKILLLYLIHRRDWLLFLWRFLVDFLLEMFCSYIKKYVNYIEQIKEMFYGDEN